MSTDMDKFFELYSDPQFGCKCSYCNIPVIIPGLDNIESHPMRKIGRVDSEHKQMNSKGGKSTIVCKDCEGKHKEAFNL